MHTFFFLLQISWLYEQEGQSSRRNIMTSNDCMSLSSSEILQYRQKMKAAYYDPYLSSLLDLELQLLL